MLKYSLAIVLKGELSKTISWLYTVVKYRVVVGIIDIRKSDTNS